MGAGRKGVVNMEGGDRRVIVEGDLRRVIVKVMKGTGKGRRGR